GEADESPPAGRETPPGVAERATYKDAVPVDCGWFDARHEPTAFPSGYGQSYTTFAYRDLRIAGSAARIAVDATVTNTGARTGTAVPQLYVGLPSPGPGVVQPPRQLRGYTKLSLAPRP